MNAPTLMQPGACPETDPRTFVLRVDAQNLIVHVNANWLAFGMENHYPIRWFTGQALMQFITDSSTQNIYAALMKRAREHRIPLAVPFRCDSPVLRRFMEMQVVPLPDEEIEFRSHILRTESRRAVRLLEPGVGRGGEFIRMCSWCKKVAIPEWVEVEEGVRQMRWFEEQDLPKITHGICPVCEQKLMAGFEATTPR